MFYHSRGVNEDVHSLILCLYVCGFVWIFSNYVGDSFLASKLSHILYAGCCFAFPLIYANELNHSSILL